MRHLVWTLSGCIISSLLISPQIAGAREGNTSKAQIASKMAAVEASNRDAGESSSEVKKNKSNQVDDAFSSVPIDFAPDRDENVEMVSPIKSLDKEKDTKVESPSKKKGKKNKSKQAKSDKTEQTKASTDKAGAAKEPAKEQKPLAQKIPKYFQDAVTLQSVNMFDNAIGLYKMAILDDPQFVSSYNNVAQCLLARGGQRDLAEAEQMLAKALKLDPQNVGSLHAAAMIKETKKDYVGAQDAYKKILSIQPLNYQAVQNLAELYFIQGKKAEARAVLENVLKSKPPEQQRQIYEQALANLEKGSTSQPLKAKEQSNAKGSALANLNKSGKTESAKNAATKKTDKLKESRRPKAEL